MIPTAACAVHQIISNLSPTFIRTYFIKIPTFILTLLQDLLKKTAKKAAIGTLNI